MEQSHRGGNVNKEDSIGALAVMTRKTLECLDEFYDFFAKNEIHVKINPLIYEGKGEENHGQLGLRPGEYGTALAYLFDRWFYDSTNRVDILPLSEAMGNLLLGKTRSCALGDACYRYYLEVDPNGDIYPCGTWNPLTYRVGNINSQEPREIFASGVLKNLETARSRARRSCGDCQYLPVCHAGCVRLAHMVKGDLSDRDYYCPDYKILYAKADKLLSEELGDSRVVSAEDWQSILSHPNPRLKQVASLILQRNEEQVKCERGPERDCVEGW